MNKWFSLAVYFAFFVGGYLVGWLRGRKVAKEETKLLFNLVNRLLTHVLREKMNFKDPLKEILEKDILQEVQHERKEE